MCLFLPQSWIVFAVFFFLGMPLDLTHITPKLNLKPRTVQTLNSHCAKCPHKAQNSLRSSQKQTYMHTHILAIVVSITSLKNLFYSKCFLNDLIGQKQTMRVIIIPIMHSCLYFIDCYGNFRFNNCVLKASWAKNKLYPTLPKKGNKTLRRTV